jgi:LPXTG-motif cell wall-anchored protein
VTGRQKDLTTQDGVTTEATPPRGTITRTALAAALLVLAGLIVWVGLTRTSSDRLGIVLATVLLPLLAAALLLIRRDIGATLAIFAALLGAFYGLVLSICILCPPPPLSAEAIALWVTALAIYLLALLELRTLGLLWVALVIPVAIIALSGNVIFIAVGLVVAAIVVWLLVKRRRSRSGASADESRGSGQSDVIT